VTEKDSSPLTESAPNLLRQLGLFDSTMMMMGIVIGSGIFLTTGIMAKSIPSAGLILLAWGIGGVLILAGALTYAELGAAMPDAGGQYVYLREAYGPLFGFLFGWKLFLVNMTGSIAALGVAFAVYFGYFFPSLSTQRKLFETTIALFGKDFSFSISVGQIVAVLIILLFSLFNYVGVIFGKTIQNIFTVLKIGAMIAIIVFGFVIGRGNPLDFSLNPAGLSFTHILIGLGVALIAVSWAFDGWNNVNYVASEIKKPQRNLPLALLIGTIGITLLYILMNLIYFYALSIPEMSGVVRVAEKSATALLGRKAADLVSVVVILSVLGALNGAIFAGARVYYAMAKDKLFFNRVGRLHPRFRTPSFAILIQAIWACILGLTGTFEQLFTYAMFIGVLFWVIAAGAVFTLRKKYPDLQRPYKTWGYPLVPLLFIIALSGVLLNALVKKPVESLIGLLFAGAGIPVYYIWKRRTGFDEQDLLKYHKGDAKNAQK
jgi:APA family basic amino acid/polyamine antiporter